MLHLVQRPARMLVQRPARMPGYARYSQGGTSKYYLPGL